MQVAQPSAGAPRLRDGANDPLAAGSGWVTHSSCAAIPQAQAKSRSGTTRPPRLVPDSRHVRVIFAGVTIADSTRALHLLETSHPPTWYIPPQDMLGEYLVITRSARAGASSRVVPQAGDFHGGWVSPYVVGPYEGGPVRAGW